MSEPVAVDDPRLPFVADVLDKLWSVEVDAFPSVEFEAQTVLGAVDQWERENTGQRPTAEKFEELQARLSRTQAALQAAVFAFDNPSSSVEVFDGQAFFYSVAMPRETVETWRLLAGGM